MIQLSEIFSMVGENGCADVATSLAMQGAETDISIPIYEVFYLKILFGEGASFLCNSIGEFNALRQLSTHCGAVAATINVLDQDFLTLAGIECVATPNYGMNVFFKLGGPAIDMIDSGMLSQLSGLAGIPLPDTAFDIGEVAAHLLGVLQNMLVDTLDDNLSSYGIEVHDWEELPAFYQELKASGEMAELSHYRAMMGGAIL